MSLRGDDQLDVVVKAIVIVCMRGDSDESLAFLHLHSVLLSYVIRATHMANASSVLVE
jgi:hypothetical protein